MTFSWGPDYRFDSEGERINMNFLFDFLFVSLQQIFVAIVTALFQVPLDVITAALTGAAVPTA